MAINFFGWAFLYGWGTANKIIDYVTRAKKKSLLLKVDFEKAYDSVSWKFLNYMMFVLVLGIYESFGVSISYVSVNEWQPNK